MDFIHFLLKSVQLSSGAAVPLLIGAGLMWVLIRVIGGDNDIKAWHFIGWRNPVTGIWQGDIDNLGRMGGFVSAVFVIFWDMYRHDYTKDFPFAEMILIVLCLIYLGGITAFSAWLRAFADRRYATPAPAEKLAEPEPTKVQREITNTVSDKTIVQEPAK